MRRTLLLSVLLASHRPLWAALSSEVAEPSATSAISRSSGFKDLGTNMVGTSAKELSCLLSKADPSAAKGADKFAEGLENALKKIKFPPQTFSRTALLHFLSQILVESAHLTTTEQKDPPSADKKGWGMLQVTGPDNLMACRSCMNECDPGSGTKMLAGPLEASVGDKAPDRTNAALISLCWWRTNMAKNKEHAKITNDESSRKSESVTQIVNAGGVGKKVTGGQKNLDARRKLFDDLKKTDGGGICRQI